MNNDYHLLWKLEEVDQEEIDRLVTRLRYGCIAYPGKPTILTTFLAWSIENKKTKYYHEVGPYSDSYKWTDNTFSSKK